MYVKTPSQAQPQLQTPGQILAKYAQSAPVNVIALAHDLGLNVWGMHTLDPSISGKIFRDPMNGGTSGFSIAVNATEAYTRQRFTIAHEIAHFILHRSKLEAGDLVDDSIYRSGLSSKEEADANRLAADILMPRPLISRMVSAGNRDVQTLANQFQVSIPAMQIRLGIPVV